MSFHFLTTQVAYDFVSKVLVYGYFVAATWASELFIHGTQFWYFILVNTHDR